MLPLNQGMTAASEHREFGHGQCQNAIRSTQICSLYGPRGIVPVTVQGKEKPLPLPPGVCLGCGGQV